MKTEEKVMKASKGADNSSHSITAWRGYKVSHACTCTPVTLFNFANHACMA